MATATRLAANGPYHFTSSMSFPYRCLMSASVLVCTWEEVRERARAIRYGVFVEEQGVPEALEWDDMDAPSWHALAFAEDGTPVATGRLLPDAISAAWPCSRRRAARAWAPECWTR
ncbi:hypothetical protein [Bradyrhizobium sp. Leo121]|uniref:GNAT family N-acetyltransferase n=1 Tax=Bradyrhizobium sp. Leo121 TaxID=1571195 RepID=UPI001AEC8772|nr:hypothetical protein [Bradyrhizobium sp. Leo121]